jgi:hypothetical protein
MGALVSSGLADAADQIYTCFNGNEESLARSLVPAKAKIIMHGMDSFAENLTLVMIEKLVKVNPDAYFLYFHGKCSTHTPNNDEFDICTRWRRCMLKRNVLEWRRAVDILGRGYDAVGCHFRHHQCDGTHHFFAGNYWWAQSNFLRRLPSIYSRERIRTSGIAAPESRHEAEVILGNGGMFNAFDLDTSHAIYSCP